jgi:cation diffusion facilitator CzcD-associated flavoprotein CzcO
VTLSRRDFLVSSAAASMAGLAPRLRAAGNGPPDVIVIGAGLSGLETALTLEENGYKVLVLEGRRRVGGVSTPSSTCRGTRRRAATPSPTPTAGPSRPANATASRS